MSAHAVTVELYYSGSWHNLTTSDVVRTSTIIATNRYGANQTLKINPGSTKVTVSDALGEYNPANPMSSLYGSVSRNTPMRITIDGVVRWIGEASEWKPRRILGGDRITDITGGGILRRLGIGVTPIRAPMRAYMNSTNPIGHWPMDDITKLAADVGEFQTVEGSPVEYTVPGLAASGNTPALPISQDRSPISVIHSSVAGTSTDWTVSFWVRAAPPELQTGFSCPIIDFAEIQTSGGTIGYHMFKALSNPSANQFEVWVYAWSPQRTLITSPGVYSVACTNMEILDNKWHMITFRATQAGSTATMELSIDDASTYYSHGMAYSTDQTIGRITDIYFPNRVGPNAVSNFSVSNLAVWDPAISAIPTWYEAGLGYPGEIAYTRFGRICNENGISHIAYASGASDSHLMGPQRSGKLLDILYECAATDGGILYESATSAELVLKCYGTLCNQSSILSINVDDDLVPNLSPTIGDSDVRNKVTAVRAGGSSSTYELTSGPMSTQDPPNGVGIYDTQLNVNPYLDSELYNYASWLVSTMTYQGVTYGKITLDLDAHALNTGSVDIGSVVTLTGLQPHDDPTTPRLMVVGMEESTDTHRRQLTLIVTPADPYDTEVLDTGGYLDCGATLTNEALDTTETGVDVIITDVCTWTHASGDYNILIGGELMTVTAVSAITGTYPTQYQTLTVTRSVNSVVKSHATGAEVHVANPVILAL